MTKIVATCENEACLPNPHSSSIENFIPTLTVQVVETKQHWFRKPLPLELIKEDWFETSLASVGFSSWQWASNKARRRSFRSIKQGGLPQRRSKSRVESLAKACLLRWFLPAELAQKRRLCARELVQQSSSRWKALVKALLDGGADVACA